MAKDHDKPKKSNREGRTKENINSSSSSSHIQHNSQQHSLPRSQPPPLPPARILPNANTNIHQQQQSHNKDPQQQQQQSSNEQQVDFVEEVLSAIHKRENSRDNQFIECNLNLRHHHNHHHCEEFPFYPYEDKCGSASNLDEGPSSAIAGPSGASGGAGESSNELLGMTLLEEPVFEDWIGRTPLDRIAWEYVTVSLSRVAGYGFGIAVSGGRDNPHFANGDPAIAISDVLRGGPAQGKLLVNDRILKANDICLENVDYARAVQVLRDSGPNVQLVVKRRRVLANQHNQTQNINNNSTPINSIENNTNSTGGFLPASSSSTTNNQSQFINQNQGGGSNNNAQINSIESNPAASTANTYQITLNTKNNKRGDHGIVFSTRLFVKELKTRNTAGGELGEGDFIIKINNHSTEGMTPKEAKKLLEKDSRVKLTIAKAQNCLNNSSDIYCSSRENLLSQIQQSSSQQHCSTSGIGNDYSTNPTRDIHQYPYPNQNLYVQPPTLRNTQTPSSISSMNHHHTTSNSKDNLNKIHQHQNSSSELLASSSSHHHQNPEESGGFEMSGAGGSSIAALSGQARKDFLAGQSQDSAKSGGGNSSSAARRQLNFANSGAPGTPIKDGRSNYGMRSMNNSSHSLDDPGTIIQEVRLIKFLTSEEDEDFISSASGITSGAGGKQLGVRLIGGNNTGVFISEIQMNSIAELKGLRVGDKVVEINGRDVTHLTREEIVNLINLKCLRELLVKNNLNDYDTALNSTYNDDYFIRTNFKYGGDKFKGEISFKKFTVFRVIDSLVGGNHGQYKAHLINHETLSEEINQILIPNYLRAEEILKSQMSSKHSSNDAGETPGSAGKNGVKNLTSRSSSFFKRYSNKSKNGNGNGGNGGGSNGIENSSSSNSRSHSKRKQHSQRSKSYGFDNLNPENEIQIYDEISGAEKPYYKVSLKSLEYKRPVILFGAIASIAFERLTLEYPGLFLDLSSGSYSNASENASSSTRITSNGGSGTSGNKKLLFTRLTKIREAMKMNKHSILCINPNSIKKLIDNDIIPIVIFIKVESRSTLKDFYKSSGLNADYLNSSNYTGYGLISSIRSSKDTSYTKPGSSRKILEENNKFEKNFSHLFNFVLKINESNNISNWIEKLYEGIENEQMKDVWVSIENYFNNKNLENSSSTSTVNEVIFPLINPALINSKRLSYASSPNESDLDNGLLLMQNSRDQISSQDALALGNGEDDEFKLSSRRTPSSPHHNHGHGHHNQTPQTPQKSMGHHPLNQIPQLPNYNAPPPYATQGEGYEYGDDNMTIGIRQAQDEYFPIGQNSKRNKENRNSQTPTNAKGQGQGQGHLNSNSTSKSGKMKTPYGHSINSQINPSTGQRLASSSNNSNSPSSNCKTNSGNRLLIGNSSSPIITQLAHSPSPVMDSHYMNDPSSMYSSKGKAPSKFDYLNSMTGGHSYLEGQDHPTSSPVKVPPRVDRTKKPSTLGKSSGKKYSGGGGGSGKNSSSASPINMLDDIPVQMRSASQRLFYNSGGTTPNDTYMNSSSIISQAAAVAAAGNSNYLYSSSHTNGNSYLYNNSEENQSLSSYEALNTSYSNSNNNSSRNNNNVIKKNHSSGGGYNSNMSNGNNYGPNDYITQESSYSFGKAVPGPIVRGATTTSVPTSSISPTDSFPLPPPPPPPLPPPKSNNYGHGHEQYPSSSPSVLIKSNNSTPSKPIPPPKPNKQMSYLKSNSNSSPSPNPIKPGTGNNSNCYLNWSSTVLGHGNAIVPAGGGGNNGYDYAYNSNSTDNLRNSSPYYLNVPQVNKANIAQKKKLSSSVSTGGTGVITGGGTNGTGERDGGGGYFPPPPLLPTNSSLIQQQLKENSSSPGSGGLSNHHNGNSAFELYRKPKHFESINSNYSSAGYYNNGLLPPPPTPATNNSNSNKNKKIISKISGTIKNSLGGELICERTEVSIKILPWSLNLTSMTSGNKNINSSTDEDFEQEIYFIVYDNSSNVPIFDGDGLNNNSKSSLLDIQRDCNIGIIGNINQNQERILTPLVEFGPEGLIFNKPVEIQLPILINSTNSGNNSLNLNNENDNSFESELNAGADLLYSNISLLKYDQNKTESESDYEKFKKSSASESSEAATKINPTNNNPQIPQIINCFSKKDRVYKKVCVLQVLQF